MTLRSLLEKATGGVFHTNNRVVMSSDSFPDPNLGGRTNHVAMFTRQEDADEYVALHNCADELLRVVEHSKRVAKWYVPKWETAEFRDGYVHPIVDLIAALRDLREKEGRV